MIAAWDKTRAPESRGGTLFESVVAAIRRPRRSRGADTLFAEPWKRDGADDDAARPASSRARPPRRFAWAVEETTRRYGHFDVAWGDVHRVRRGNVDVPVGGCASDLGCFRVLTYRDDPDGKRVATGRTAGSSPSNSAISRARTRCWRTARARDRTRRSSADQAEMFARGELKPVAWSERDIAQQTVDRYRPGEAK